jgi:hypothetical protein
MFAAYGVTQGRDEAATPEQALQRAHQIESEETETLDFPSYDSGAGVEHIEIRSADGKTVAEWRHEDLSLRLATRDLLESKQKFAAWPTDRACARG